MILTRKDIIVALARAGVTVKGIEAVDMANIIMLINPNDVELMLDLICLAIKNSSRWELEEVMNKERM